MLGLNSKPAGHVESLARWQTRSTRWWMSEPNFRILKRPDVPQRLCKGAMNTPAALQACFSGLRSKTNSYHIILTESQDPVNTHLQLCPPVDCPTNRLGTVGRHFMYVRVKRKAMERLKRASTEKTAASDSFVDDTNEDNDPEAGRFNFWS